MASKPTKPAKPKVPGLVKGLGVTLRTAKETMFPDGMLRPPAPSESPSSKRPRWEGSR